jgi:hypothetical protein
VSDDFTTELTPLSAIKPKLTRWLWEGRIPLGALGLWAGYEGSGKSQFAAWMAAGTTRGTLPGALSAQPRPVIVVATEDSFAHTIVPRMTAAGADLSMVYRMRVREVKTGSAVSLSLPADNDRLRQAVLDLGAALVITDPLMSVIGARLDTHKAREVRTALDPLAEMTIETGAALGGITHFTKATGRDPISMITDSHAFKDVARLALVFALDTGETGVMSQVKNSLGRMPLPSCAYRFDVTRVMVEDQQQEVPRLAFTGNTPRHVENLLDRSGASAIAHAKDWLGGYLTTGPREAKEVIEYAEQGEDISHSTLMRAKKDLGVRSVKINNVWHWMLAMPVKPGLCRNREIQAR